MERAFAVLQISKSSCKLLINFKSLYIYIPHKKNKDCSCITLYPYMTSNMMSNNKYLLKYSNLYR